MGAHSSAFRTYKADELGKDGYPGAWHAIVVPDRRDPRMGGFPGPGVKHMVREQAGHRCVRCGHPYRKETASAKGEWSPCDEQCRHVGPLRYGPQGLPFDTDKRAGILSAFALSQPVEARWRILTVHHLTGNKADLRWWNLVALCQKCHLQVQGRVRMERVWAWEHTPWMKPYAAGYYALTYLGEELDRAETQTRLDELLALERAA
jgi:5-methylcytosine-specific restriction endonuclease McrA